MGCTEADCPDARPDACLPLALCPAPGCARSWGCPLPALGPNQLSWHLQPSRLSRGLSDAQCVYEPAAPATGPYPSMPGTTADPSMVSAYMYPAGASGAQAAPQAQAGPTTSPVFSSYQPTPTPGYQNVASQASQSLPTISQPPQTSTIGYMGGQPMAMSDQPYNMQNLMTTLPGQDAPLPAQQPYITGQQPMYQKMAPNTGPPQQQPSVAQPLPTQGPPAQGSEAQLISFD